MTITCKKSNKLPSVNSLYISTKGMLPRHYSTLINMNGSCYDKKNQEIELSIMNLYLLVKIFSKFEDINIIDETVPTYKKETIKIPTNHKWKINPYKHQLRAIEYGLNHDGWLLLDDMGLGKTKTIIDLADILKKSGEIKHCFIICGIASLRYNWANEIEKNSNSNYCILGRRFNSKGKEVYDTVEDRIKTLKAGIKEFFVIVNVETLSNSKFAEAFNKSKSSFDMIVFDEIHACKNPSSKSSKTLLKLKAKKKIGLTGTIITSHPEDCYVPLKWSGNTKSNYSEFKNMYNIYGGFNNLQVLGHKNLILLKELLSTCALRRVKSQILDLPLKNYIIEYVEMGKEQRDLYSEVEESVLENLDKLDHIPTIIEEITINTRLRQITASPSMLSSTVSNSAKIERCAQLVDDIISQGDKVVVFCNFKATAREVAERFKKYNALLCTGDIDDKEMTESIKKFQEDKSYKVFVGTWQRCGTGITLTAASYMVFIDTPWTNSDFQQSCDRIYRIGQEKPVFIYTLITKNSYDERVQEIIERKENLAKDVIVDIEE